MKTIYIKLRGPIAVPLICDCGEPIKSDSEGYYCLKCDERIKVIVKNDSG